MQPLTPIVFNPEKETLEGFKKRLPVERVIDTYTEQLKELFLIRNPQYKFNPNYQPELAKFTQEHVDKGVWFYFPWDKYLVRYLPDEMHQELRTARNKNLITREEQAKFYNFTVGIAGLSVGSHGALTLAMMGGGRVMKLADPDEISGSNLNRIRYDFTKVGRNKCGEAAELVWQMNPYGEVFTYPEGLNADNIDEFLAGPPRLDLLIEEVDNLEMKIRLRLKARELGIPVIMVTDNGDGVIVDIERYDLEPQLELFSGAAGKLTLEEFQKIPPPDLPRLAAKIAGPKMTVPRMLTSLLEVGKTLYSWPQLGDAATLAGVVIAYLTKRLALGEKTPSGKLEVSLDAIFDPDYHSPAKAAERDNIRRDFMQKLGLE